jgi:hypothetical protein
MPFLPMPLELNGSFTPHNKEVMGSSPVIEYFRMDAIILCLVEL